MEHTLRTTKRALVRQMLRFSQLETGINAQKYERKLKRHHADNTTSNGDGLDTLPKE